jgi:hypothetical protein
VESDQDIFAVVDVTQHHGHVDVAAGALERPDLENAVGGR